MKLARVPLVGLILLLAVTASAQPWRRAWSSFFDAPANLRNGGVEIAGSKDNGAYFVSSVESINYQHFAGVQLAKLDATGATQWTTGLGYADNPILSLTNIEAREYSSGVYVAGTVSKLYPVGNEVFLAKYNANGQRQFVKYFGTNQNFVQIIVDSLDDVFVLSTSDDSTGGFITKIDKDGTQIWTTQALNSRQQANSWSRIQLDPNGNIILSDVGLAGSGTAPLINKYSPDGTLLWSNVVGTNTEYFQIEARVAGDGSILAAYSSNSTTTTLVRKLSPNGSVVWSVSVPGMEARIALDANGNLFAAGANLTKISPQGVVLWSNPMNSNSYQIKTVSTDESGNVDILFSDSLRQYNTSGSLLWSQALPIGNPPQAGCSVGDVSHGGIYGVLDQSDGSTETVMKYGSSGSILWSNPSIYYPHTPAYQMQGATDANGTTTFWGYGIAGSYAAFNSVGSLVFSKPDGELPYDYLYVPVVRLMPGGGFVKVTTKAIARYDAAGNVVWQNPLSMQYGATVDLAIDSTGNSYIIGPDPALNGFVEKYDSLGALLWHVTLPTNQKYLRLISIDPSGDAIILGSRMCKVSSSGAIVWNVPLPLGFQPASPPYDHVELDIDSSGNTYITDNQYANGSTQGFVHKYSAAGQFLWSSNLIAGLYSPVYESVLDNLGTLYSAGETRINGVNRMAIFAITTSGGGIKWVITPNYGATSGATNVVLDNHKNPIVAGWQYAGGGADYALLALSPSGAIWAHSSYDSGLGLSERPSGLGTDSQGNAYVFGCAFGPSNTYDFNVVKFLPPLPNDASIIQSSPSPMEAGKSYPVKITATNVGMNTWTAAAGYKLDCLEPSTWGVTSVALTSTDSMAPEQTKVFSANVVAPATPGTYALQWKMEKSGTQFGTTSQVVNVKVLAQTNFATFVGQTVPSSMVAGQSYFVTLQYKNTGTNTWTSANGIRLQSVSPVNNTNWGTNRLYLNASVAPGATGTFSGTVIAPSNNGTYTFQWQPIQDSTGLSFGSPSTAVSVAVAKGVDAARYIAKSNPSTVNAGSDFTATFTMMNVGTSTWTTGNYTLRPIFNNWSVGAIALSSNVAPGAQVGFSRILTAPITPGTYQFQWQMFKASFFGDKTPLVTIQVTAGADNAQYVSETAVPTSVGLGTTFGVTFTMKNLGTATWGSGYNLVPLGNSFGISGIASGSVAPNANGTFTATFTAPSTTGTYFFQWRMSHSGTKFGQTTPLISIVVGTDAAQYISRTGPNTVAAGSDFFVQNTMKNTGTSGWSGSGGYYMMSQSPANSTTWTLNKLFLPGPGPFAPGSTVTFTGKCTAPITPGTYTMQWQMSKSGVAFGEKTPLLSITVTQSPDDAKFVDQTGIPTNIAHGNTFGAIIIMGNIGTANWDSNYTLVSIGTDNFGHQTLPITLTDQNKNSSFQATFTAPSTPGIYKFQFRMQHGTTQFGQPTIALNVNVT